MLFMQKIRTNDLFSSEFDLLLQPRTSNLFLLQNQNTSTTTTITNIKVGEQKEKTDIQFDILLDTILSNLNIIKNQIKF